MVGKVARSVLTTAASRYLQRVPRHSVRRSISTAPRPESRSWKSSAARWGLAIGGLYYYNTSPVFAEEPAYAVSQIPDTEYESEALPSIDAIAAKRRQQSAPPIAAAAVPSSSDGSAQSATVDALGPKGPETGSVGELEEGANSQGAFNPETGEINWDCPCLGGMAHGPCGEQFRAAFSCFVYSKEEPKGMDCIDRFRGMQDCFREHPDIYGAELDDDEEGQGAPASRDESAVPGEFASASPATALADAAATAQLGTKLAAPGPAMEEEAQGNTGREGADPEQVKASQSEQTSESKDTVPKACHDATLSNEGK